MSRRNVSVSTTTTPLATTALEAPQINAFVRSAIEKYGLTEEEVKKRATEMCGFIERYMQADEASKARDKAALERAFPNGYDNAIQVGRKPKPGEEVNFAQVKDDLMIRVWVLSIEESLERAKATSLYSHATRHDPNWETYVIPEGTILRITQQNHPDSFFTYQCDTLLVRLALVSVMFLS
ncbi:hypothetical protein AX14_009188 [Amanita brunnescens Koide BX004]|nr:hypothetical protein AX14_009188 [Amanita brunnescens Koide BX004]